MIRPCTQSDFDAIYEIINDAARAYCDVIPSDRWHEPYMSRDALAGEMKDGVAFWGEDTDGTLSGVMGIQDRNEVTLIRHAYVRTNLRNQGIGTRLLHHLETMTNKPVLIGTWKDAVWAISFYEKNGYTRVGEEEKNRLLRTYWNISERQVATSVVLADGK
jgi:GNAT superfamily N-acetyltransferase